MYRTNCPYCQFSEGHASHCPAKANNCAHGVPLGQRCTDCEHQSATGLHALNCPCDQCRPDLATKRANQAFHAELVKLNRNVEGLTGIAATLAEETRAMNRHMAAQSVQKSSPVMAPKVEPKKAEGSNEGGFECFVSPSGQRLVLRPSCVYRVGEDGTVSQWTKMLGAVTEGEMYEAATIANVSIDKAEVLLTNFARSRGLMP